jgi:hypothetical protein
MALEQIISMSMVPEESVPKLCGSQAVGKWSEIYRLGFGELGPSCTRFEFTMLVIDTMN